MQASWLGCLTSEFGGKGLAIGPNGAVFEEFFLPDRDGAFESVNQPAAGVKGSGAMGGGDHDQDTGFPYLKATEAVNDGEVTNGEFGHGLGSKISHLFSSHWFVGFILKIKR